MTGALQNILFITHTRIGDAVLSSGILRHLVDRYPHARFTIACGPLAVSLFEAVPRRDATVVVTKRPFDGHWVKLWREVRSTPWDLVVDLRRSLVSYFLSARSRRVLGPARSNGHQVEYLSSVLGESALAPHLFTAPHHADVARRLVPDGAPVLALGPMAATAAKTWPAARFAELAQRLTRAGAPCAGWRIALFGSNDDRAAVDSLIAALDLPLLIFGEADLLTVHAALGRCQAFVGNDSGLGHLAACAGVPTLAIFGPMDPARYAPWGPRCASIRAPGGDIAALDSAVVFEAMTGLLQKVAA